MMRIYKKLKLRMTKDGPTQTPSIVNLLKMEAPVELTEMVLMLKKN